MARRITTEHAALLEQARAYLADAGSRHGDLLAAVVAAVRRFLEHVRDRVLGEGGDPDLDRFPAEDVWLRMAHASLDRHIEQAFEAAYLSVLDQAADPGQVTADLYRTEPFVEHHIDTVESRLRDWPAAVFEEIRHELHQAHANNETTDQLRDRVGAVLGIDALSREIRDRIDRISRDIDAAPDPGARAALRSERAALYRDLRDEDRLWQWRANRIARTELTAAVNGGQYRANVTLTAATGEATRKQWLATTDERTRPSHAAANGQTRDLGDPFLIGGAPLQYPGDPAGPPGETINCRCALIVVPAGTEPVPLYPIGETGSLAAAAPEGNAMTTITETPAPDTDPGTRPVPDGWRGILAPLDTLSCHGKIFVNPGPDGLDTRPLPLPLLGQEQLAPGHDGAVMIGRIDRAWIDGNDLWGEGTFDLANDTARDWARRLGEGFASWVSVDLDNVTAVPVGVDADGKPYDITAALEELPAGHEIADRCDKWRLMGSTMVWQQAFPEARVAGLTGYSGQPGTGTDIVQAAAAPPFPPKKDPAVEDHNPDTQWVPEVGDRVVVDSGDASGPGEVTDVDTTGDPVIVTVQLDAGGVVTVDVAEVMPERPAEASPAETASARLRAFRSLSAAGTLAPPAEWFEDPHLAEHTWITVDGDRVFGHVCAWETCHLSFSDTCITPPHSASGYALFHTGEVLCAGGELVPVGKITLGTGHADMQDGFQAAADHYDNTGTAVAVVHLYEDAHGIAAAGALCPGVTDEQVAALRRSPLSGDWRRVGGSMELVAALCVNVPGFPVPRLTTATADLGRQTSLVAAGRLVRVPAEREQWSGDVRELAAAAVDEYARRARRRASAAAKLADRPGPAWGSTRAALAWARIRGDADLAARAAAAHGYPGGK